MNSIKFKITNYKIWLWYDLHHRLSGIWNNYYDSYNLQGILIENNLNVATYIIQKEWISLLGTCI